MFSMGTIRLPPKIVAHLDKIIRHCLLRKQTTNGIKCSSLAAWDMICRPKKSGGLGIINLWIRNNALLLKVLHKFYNQQEMTWVTLNWNTYYKDSVPHVTDPCGSFWWRDLIHLMLVCRGVTRVQIHNGSSALVWKDDWNQAIYSKSFPRAYSFINIKDASVREFLTITRLHAAFHLPLSLQAHEEVRQLQIEVTDTVLLESPDIGTYVWGATIFKTTSYYAYYFGGVVSHEAFQWLCTSNSVPKIKVFG